MAVFAYRALTAAGKGTGGVVAADTAHAAWERLRARGVFPTDVSPQDAPEAARAAWGARRLGAAERAAAVRGLATLVAAGIPAADALAAVAEQSDHPALAHALTIAETRIREGHPLADALAASPRVFPPLFQELVRVGEASGTLAAVLDRLAEHGEAAAAVRARLAATLTYPAVMLAATLAVLAFLLAWVVPQVTHLFAETGTRLPLSTRLLVAGVAFGRATWWAWLLAAAGGAWAFGAWAARPEGRAALDAAVLRVPVVGGIVGKAAVARLARTLATLTASGVPLEPALAIAGRVAGNHRVGAAVARVRDRVREGEALAAALGTDEVFPPLLVRLAAAGERSGALAPALERAARSYEADVGAAVATATALVEPAVILLMGAVVLVLVTAVLLPLFQLNTLVRLG